MTHLNKQLDTLFERWIDSYPDDKQGSFCKDGLMLKPNGDVEELWQKAKRRVMFVLKDNPDSGQDTRTWFQDPDVRYLKKQFFQRLAEVFYALLNLTYDKESREAYGFGNVKRELHGKVEETFNTEPFAFIEAKKLAGKDTVSYNEVYDAMTRDEKFFKEELEILRPNIIICCDGENSQFNFITSHYFNGKTVEKIEYAYPNVPGIECGLWYYPTEHVAVIKSNHPGNIMDESMFFEKIISPYHALLKKHPGF